MKDTFIKGLIGVLFGVAGVIAKATVNTKIDEIDAKYPIKKTKDK